MLSTFIVSDETKPDHEWTGLTALAHYCSLFTIFVPVFVSEHDIGQKKGRAFSCPANHITNRSLIL